MPPKFQPPLYDHRLPREDRAADIQYGIRPGESWLIGYTEDEVWDHIMAPTENLPCQALRDHGRPDVLPLVPRYNAFLILLGTVRPMQVDGVWDRKGLLYNPYMANMLTKRSTCGVTWAGMQVQEGQTAVCTVAYFKYSLCVYKNPKVGHQPPRVVPMLTNVWFARKGPPHRRGGREVHPVVAAYRTLLRGVGWCEPDGPADEAGWPTDDMGPHSACVRAPVRGCECVRNLRAIGTLQGDH